MEALAALQLAAQLFRRSLTMESLGRVRMTHPQDTAAVHQ